MSSLAGRIAVVTGGASGIGAAIVQRLLADGAIVEIADIASSPATDITNETSCIEFAQRVVDAHGHVDIVVLAAAIVLSADHRVLTDSLDAWSRVIDVNLTGTLLPLRALEPYIANNASIITITSGEYQHATPGNGAYCVAKSGVWMLTKTLALELAHRQIRVNAVAPGFIETPMTQAFLDAPGRRDKVVAITPLGRLGQPNDVADAIAWLAGDQSSFVTGTTIWVDGGIAVNER
ncbi:MAG: SDR family oxidoreductase [Ilumatobacteraceae bacterium]|nr:SDR family oxidoreductase [Ilumatobacteraceae bacterium]